jgi:hypothetical protein
MLALSSNSSAKFGVKVRIYANDVIQNYEFGDGTYLQASVQFKQARLHKSQTVLVGVAITDTFLTSGFGKISPLLTS